ncbi:MAG TPA: hypothetical protein VF158_15030 [Longimicrobiales bacterium]
MQRKGYARVLCLVALLALPVVAAACNRGAQDQYVETPEGGAAPTDTVSGY